MKKIISILLTIALIMGLVVTSYADNDKIYDKEEIYAQALFDLGLFLGTDKGFELDRSLTRTEAIVMMIRMLGKAEMAASFEKTHPFTDVPEWADGYVSYAYDRNLTMGVSDTLFGADEPVESNMYLTFILRAMGYSDENGADFIWQMPYALASELEMLPPKTNLKDFIRADAVTFTAASLFALCKDTDAPLYEHLIDDGVFTKEEWERAFSTDPFTEYKAQNRAIATVIESESGEVEKNRYEFYNHMLLDTQEDKECIKALVITHEARYTVNENNGFGSTGSGNGRRVFLLDKNTNEVIGEEPIDAFKYSDHFPESAIGPTNNFMWQGMNIRLGKKMSEIIASGALAYKPFSYEEVLLKYTENSLYSIKERIETEECTILIGYLSGVPHGPAGFIYLIYKPGSQLGDGETCGAPLPEINGWGAAYVPDEVTISDDGTKMFYSFSFDEEMVLKDGENILRVIHEAGTYNYTTDLVTGNTDLEIIKEK